MVETSEREMVHKLNDEVREKSFTSLQPTYEDTVPDEGEDDWDYLD